MGQAETFCFANVFIRVSLATEWFLQHMSPFTAARGPGARTRILATRWPIGAENRRSFNAG